MDTLSDLFAGFLRERTYVQNVSPKTLAWYDQAWRSFARTYPACLTSPTQGTLISRADLEHFFMQLRQRGVRPVSCNCWLRALHAFCQWLHQEGHTAALVRIPLQRLDRPVLRPFTEADLRRLVRFHPTTVAEWRIHALALTLLDTGCRMQEVLSAPVEAFDWDQLLLTVRGKGRKERRVPFSHHLRKLLVRWVQRRDRAIPPSPLMFPARTGTSWHYRNARRSYYALLRRLGLPRHGFHHLRHTFATQYLKAGGDVVRLSIILGHTEISTTMR